jgi:drug/metabolite transporter (DMT)-like permease
VFGVALGGLLLQEPVSLALLLAVTLIGAGIYLVNRPAPENGPA